MSEIFNGVSGILKWTGITLITELCLFAYMHGTPEGAILGSLAGQYLQPLFDFFGLTGWAPTGLENSIGASGLTGAGAAPVPLPTPAPPLNTNIPGMNW